MRPLIALTCSTEQAGGVAQRRDFTNCAYSRAVSRAGGAPMLVPSADEAEPIRAALGSASGVLITGGKDICPAVYGEKTLPFCGPIEPSRDDLDRWVIEAASELELPVLAICRGIQALAAFLGGSLYQDIEAQFQGAAGHRQTEERTTPTHDVRIAPGSALSGIVGTADLPVNSFHHQAVKEVPPGFHVSARAPDRVIEAIEAEGNRFCLGVQWHPEEMAAGEPPHQALFDAFVEAARRHRSPRGEPL